MISKWVQSGAFDYSIKELNYDAWTRQQELVQAGFGILHPANLIRSIHTIHPET